MDIKTKIIFGSKHLSRLEMRAMLEADPIARPHFGVAPEGRITRLDTGPAPSGAKPLQPKMESAPAATTPHMPAPSLTPDQQRFLRKVACDRRSMAQIVADAAALARTLDSDGAALDPEVRLGLARSRDLLVLFACAMAPGSHAELLAKHEALAGVQPLDPAFGDLTIVVNAALSSDWRRFEAAKRHGFPPAAGDSLH